MKKTELQFQPYSNKKYFSTTKLQDNRIKTMAVTVLSFLYIMVAMT